jgi:2-oxoisovalerate dehydrogenase E1 component
MAIGGWKPVVEIQFGDYSYPGYMQMRNEISTLRWRSAGTWTTPMVVRVAVGGYGRARIVQPGRDATVVTWGSGVHRAVTAAKKLEEGRGAAIEVVDVRTILPLDIDTIVQSVRRTSRVLVLHEAPLFGGLGGEVAARIADAAFESLDAPVKRMGALDTFVPFAGNLEAAVLPSVEGVHAALVELLDY